MSFVIDNAVLSSFYSAGWYQSLQIYPPAEELFVPERVWKDEFIRHRDVASKPDWLTVETVTDVAYPKLPGAVSEHDASCLALAEEQGGSIVTNDQKLIEVADERGVGSKWGTRFAIETFEECGISQTEFDDGVDSYRDDVWLPEHVCEKLSTAEKP
jgi:hypothetical protein